MIGRLESQKILFVKIGEKPILLIPSSLFNLLLILIELNN